MRIVFATENKHKLKEIREILKPLQMEILSAGEIGFKAFPEENGKTFEENAFIKAVAIGRTDDTIVMADDSGFEVSFLNGEPGVYSARFMGYDTKPEEKNEKILRLMEGVPENLRKCDYKCCIAMVLPSGEKLSVFGQVDGIVAYEACGNGGFGYDPIFFLPEKGKTMAEITEDEKNVLSHRGKALREAMKLIREKTGL